MGTGSLVHKSALKLQGLTWRRVCLFFMACCLTSLALVGLTIRAMPTTFNMRVIPSLQEINAMFIITSASRTCDDSSLPHPALAKQKDYPIPAFVEEDSFTIIINTFKRTELLHQSLQHYSQMSRVEKIIVYWSNVGVKPPDFPAILNPRVPILVEIMPAVNLSLRFSPSELITTEGRCVAAMCVYRVTGL